MVLNGTSPKNKTTEMTCLLTHSWSPVGIPSRRTVTLNSILKHSKLSISHNNLEQIPTILGNNHKINFTCFRKENIANTMTYHDIKHIP